MRLSQRLSFVRDRLRITEAQGPAWNAFVDAMRRAQQDSISVRRQAQDRLRDPQGPAPTLLDRLELRQRLLAARSARVAATLNALRPLYAALSVEQKEVADRLLMRARGPMRQGMALGARRRMMREGERGRGFGPAPFDRL